MGIAIITNRRCIYIMSLRALSPLFLDCFVVSLLAMTIWIMRSRYVENSKPGRVHTYRNPCCYSHNGSRFFEFSRDGSPFAQTKAVRGKWINRNKYNSICKRQGYGGGKAPVSPQFRGLFNGTGGRDSRHYLL